MENSNNWFQQGVQHHQAGRLADAIIAYRQVLALQPDHPQCHYNLAVALQSLEQTDAAIVSYQRAILLNPDFAEAYNNLGNILQLQDRLDEAKQAYTRALEINPNLTQAHFSLGLVLKKKNQLSLAVKHFRAALSIVPDYAEAFDNLSALLKLLGRIEEWLDEFKKHECLDHKVDWFFVIGLSACRFLGDFSREQKYLHALYSHPLKNFDTGILADLLGKAQYFDLPQSELLRLYQAYNQAVKRQHFAEFPLVSPYRSRRAKLRIGYLSADFRVHVMGKLMFEVLSRHDRSQFEVCLYSMASKEDEVTAKFRAISDKFVTLHALPARQAAMRIAEDDLDILIDLCNHTTGSNPLILAYKPARVQITHLGLHGAIGLDTVDYKLTDHYADLPENAAYLIEKLLPMEGCVFPFHHVEPDANTHFSRTSLSIPENAVVLGVFVNIMKLSPRCLQTWAAIMSRLEHAVLAFSPLRDSEKSSYLREAAAVGIDPSRVVFIPASKDEAINRARYALLDMALDTFPYSGGDTTLAALDMGVPVVTLCGQRHSERTSYSILMNLGVPQTIAESEAEFVDIACRLANDKGWRDAIVAQIQRGMNDSPLVDMDSYTRNLEDAYRRAIAACPLKEGGGTNDDNQALFREAVRHHQANRLADAATAYRQVLANQPEHVAALYLYGMLQKQTGHDGEAIEHLRQAIASRPEYLDAHQALGDIFLEQGRVEEALASFDRVLQFNPAHFHALNAKGRVLTSAGRLPQAIAVLQQAVENHPQQSVGYFNLGVAYQKQGALKLAETAFRRALALDPNDTDAQSNLDLLARHRKLSVSSLARPKSK